MGQFSSLTGPNDLRPGFTQEPTSVLLMSEIRGKAEIVSGPPQDRG